MANKTAAMATPDKHSIPGIVDPMLLTGKYTRQQIMDEVRRLRPDFKDPSAAVSNGLIRCHKRGEHPGLIEGERARHTGVKRGPSISTLADRFAKIDAWAERATAEVAEGFRRFEAFMAKPVPAVRRIWS